MKFVSSVRRIVLFGVGMLLFGLVLEGALQLLPVHSRIKGMSTDDRFPIVRAQPNQDYVYSFGWDFFNVTRGRTNNVGMFNSADYVKVNHAVAVVGDSYIEARMLPYGVTLQGRLEKELSSRGISVFAASSGGAGLADYAGLAQMLHREVSPQVLVILVGEGDLLEALNSPDEGYRGMRCEAGHVVMYHVPYQRAPRTLMRNLLGRSALLRYVEFNLKAGIWMQEILHAQGRSSGTSESLNQACLADYLHRLATLAGLDSAHILFVVDGLRGKFDPKRDALRLQQARGARGDFMALARRLGFPVIDMQAIFDHAKQEDHLRVDFNPRDNHWNGLAHQLAADAVERALLERGLLGVAGLKKQSF